MVRIGIVGFGTMGQRNLTRFERSIPQATVTAVVSRRPQVITFREKPVPVFSTIEEMLRRGLVDGVVISSEPALHAAQTIAAAKVKVHVLCEKPLSTNYAYVESMCEACSARGVLFGAIFQRRLLPGVDRVVNSIRGGSFGTVIEITSSAVMPRNEAYWNGRVWRRKIEGGVLTNIAIHNLDMAVQMCGQVIEVAYCELSTMGQGGDADRYAKVVVYHNDGARGTIFATTCAAVNTGMRLEVYGEQSYARIGPCGVEEFQLQGELQDAQRPIFQGLTDAASFNDVAIRLQLTDFVHAIRHGTENRCLLVSGESALDTMISLDRIMRRVAYPDEPWKRWDCPD